MPMHMDYAKPAVRTWLARQRPRLTLKRLKARITVAWITFDLWYSDMMVELRCEDLSREIGKQADLKKKLHRARRELA